MLPEPVLRTHIRKMSYQRTGVTCCVQSSSRSLIEVPMTRRSLCISAAQLVAGASFLARSATAADEEAKRRHLPLEELKNIIAVSLDPYCASMQCLCLALGAHGDVSCPFS